MTKKKQGEQPNTREKRIRFSDDLLWGAHPVFEALTKEPQRMAEITLLKERRGTRHEELIELARQHRVKISFVDALKITGEGSAGIRHQGIVARMSQTVLLPFDDMVAKFRRSVGQGEHPRIMVCDSLQDPHNLGAIIRSAHASGARGVLITRDKSAPLSGTAAKSSAGALSHIDISQVTNLANALQHLKKAGAWIFGAVKEDGAQSLYATDLCLPACIVVGSEGKGVRPLIRKNCDVLISIPMEGFLDSLNSSVAAGVVLFEALRQDLQRRDSA
ncbi:MAG: 23S rRNA (guanosine(2251)-2'-O)-methyltransferase RlmB [Desulfopila sp.]